MIHKCVTVCTNIPQCCGMLCGLFFIVKYVLKLVFWHIFSCPFARVHFVSVHAYTNACSPRSCVQPMLNGHTCKCARVHTYTPALAPAILRGQQCYIRTHAHTYVHMGWPFQQWCLLLHQHFCSCSHTNVPTVDSTYVCMYVHTVCIHTLVPTYLIKCAHLSCTSVRFSVCTYIHTYTSTQVRTYTYVLYVLIRMYV